MTIPKKWWFYLSLLFLFAIFIKTDFALVSALIIKILLPFIIAFAMAYFLIPFKTELERKFEDKGKKFAKKHSNGLSAAVVYIIFIALIFTVVIFIVPVIKNNFLEIIGKAPEYYNRFLLSLDGFISEHSWLASFDFNKMGENLLSGLNLFNAAKHFGSIMLFTENIFQVIMGFIILAYVLLEHRQLRKTFDRILYKFVRPKNAGEVKIMINKSVKIFRNFIYGKSVISIIIGIASGILFALLKIPYAALSAFIVAITNMIPYFGPFIGGAIIAVFVLLGKGWVGALMALAIIFAVQQLDSIYLTPKILGGAMDLSPFWTIFAISAGSVLFGFWGMFFAIPVAAVLKILYFDYLDKI